MMVMSFIPIATHCANPAFARRPSCALDPLREPERAPQAPAARASTPRGARAQPHDHGLRSLRLRLGPKPESLDRDVAHSLRGSALASAWLALSACAGPDAAHDAAPDAAHDAGPSTYAYVVGRVLTTPPDPSTAYGFDLDGRMGGPVGTCARAMDFTSPITGATAVDAQLDTLFSTIDAAVGGDGLAGRVREQIEQGAWLVVLVLDHVDDLTADADVSLRVVLARAAAGTPELSPTCAAHADAATCSSDGASACVWSAVTSSCSGIAAGQVLEPTIELGTTRAHITRGRLELGGAYLVSDYLMASCPVSGPRSMAGCDAAYSFLSLADHGDPAIWI